MSDWTPYRQELWHRQPLPPERKLVLVAVAIQDEMRDVGLDEVCLRVSYPPGVAVGYMRFAAGEKDSPVFTVPGIGGPAIAWCDCLPDGVTMFQGREDR